MDGDDNNAPGPSKRELLDVPSQSSIERKLLVGQQRPAVKPPISRPAPPSGELLGRLQSFLPQMEQANRDLQSLESAGFEEPSEGEGPVVELDLACGLFDLKDEVAVSAAERSLMNQGVAVEAYGGDTDNDSSDSDSDSDSGESGEGSSGENDGDEDGGRAAGGKERKKGGRRHPGIEEIP